MPLLARKNIRIIGSNDFVFPVLTVERIELIRSKRSHGPGADGLELFVLENGQRATADVLLFLEPIDEDLLIAMRLKAQMLARLAKIDD